MLGTIFVSGDQAAADLAVIDILPVLIGFAAVSVKAFDCADTFRGHLTEPDWCGNHEDVGRLDHLIDLGPFVVLETLVGHIGLDAGRYVVIDRTDRYYIDVVCLHDVLGGVYQPVCV